jgi:hydroxylamine reductase (hybrid-cluster protein)
LYIEQQKVAEYPIKKEKSLLYKNFQEKAIGQLAETARHIRESYEDDVQKARYQARKDVEDIKDNEKARMLAAWQHLSDKSDSKSTF